MKAPHSIVLGGVKHSGKTTLGRLLAAHFGVEFADADQWIEERYERQSGEKQSCRELYRRLGEEGFRRFEAETLAEASAGETRVLALGGGVLSNPFLAPGRLAELGLGVALFIPPRLAYERIRKNGLPPFLEKAADPWQEFQRLHAEREEALRKFGCIHFAIEGERPPEETAARLIRVIEQYWGEKGK